MSLVAISIALALVPVIAMPTSAGAVPVPWKNCGSPGDVISIQQLDASVWPPQAGAPFTVSYKLTVSEALTKGSTEHVTTSSRGESLVPVQLPIAELFSYALSGHHARSQTLGPIAAGPYSGLLTFQVPTGGPQGVPQVVRVQLTGADAAGHEAVCMQLTVPIKGGLPHP